MTCITQSNVYMIMGIAVYHKSLALLIHSDFSHLPHFLLQSVKILKEPNSFIPSIFDGNLQTRISDENL